uniref:fimbrial biogenesis chaperone n=1 Tax=Serratia proteamaculans TaxID=28151 RepID=UPI001F4BE046|nr:molecular chaperone [Serratia proteamaculans]
MPHKLSCCIISSALILSQSVIAGVQIGGSRVVYDGNQKQAAISISNPDDKPYLIQSWINKQVDNDDNDDTFITTPPIFRLEPHSQNSIRIIYTGKTIPLDKETVYWLNIKSIPSTSKDATNQLLITVKNTMKLFYRPPGLPNDASAAYKKVEFRRHNGKLYAFNPTLFSVSFYEINVNGQSVDKPAMVLPMQEIPLKHSTPESAQISWRAINDFGGISEEQKVKMQ